MKSIDSIEHVFLNAAGAVDDFLYPAAMLDPNHGANNIVWLGSGTVEAVALQSQTVASGVFIEVYDTMDINGRPIQLAATPFHRYAVVDASAVGKREGYGDPGAGIPASTLIYNVHGPATPAEIVINGRRWRHEFRDEAAANTTRSFQMVLGVRCSFGMAVRVTADAPPATAGLHVSITYTTDISGAQRFSNAQIGARGASSHIPA